MFTPRVSITSAEPFFELMLRLPCFATRTPAPATTNAVAVEMLNVALAEPPVPQVSARASSRESDSRQSAMRCRASRIMGAGIRVALWADWAIGHGTDFRRLVLHRLRERQHVPNAPEGCHFIGRAEGNANIAVHRGKTTSDQHIIFAEVLNNLFGWMMRVHHDKIRMRVDRFEHSRHRLIEEFLASVL